MRLLPYRIERRLHAYAIRRYLARQHVRFEQLPVFSGEWPLIHNEGSMRLGAGCEFRSLRLRQVVRVHRQAELLIAQGGYINDGVTISATLSITIGRHAKIGDMSCIYDTDFHPVAPGLPVRQAPVVIGDNVWLGARVMVLAGARIGDHAVVAAGSIVTGEIPARCLAAGSPARVVRPLEVPDGWVRP